MAKTLSTTPSDDGFRMPAEWEAHQGCWLLWPERTDNWRLGAKPAQQAFVAVATLGGTDLFPLAALFVAFTLLCHHAIIHRRSRFDGEVCSCAPFQAKDICNHETWIVASIVASIISSFHI